MSKGVSFQKLQKSSLVLATVSFPFQYSIQNSRSIAHQAKEEEDQTQLNFTSFCIYVHQNKVFIINNFGHYFITLSGLLSSL
jgi:hypothetical protein